MLERREFLIALVSAGAAPGVLGLVARLGLSGHELSRGPGGYGPLSPRAAENTGRFLLALPSEFQYTEFALKGSTMSDGRVLPSAHDGMASFAYGGAVRLVRNHELAGTGMPFVPAELAYDVLARGGTTVTDVDPLTRLPLRSFASLGGTVRNCAGGVTPWGSWLTCEETFDGPAQGFAHRHGYVFESPVRLPWVAGEPTPRPVKARPLKAMGRFWHEAVAVDPGTGTVYETEDRSTAGLYRFLPTRPGRLHEGGVLQMAKVVGQPNRDLRTGQTVGAALPIDWVSIAEPDPDTTDPLHVYNQGQAQGGATFARLEGAWHASGSVWLNATTGGNAALGQVWRLDPSPGGDTLTLIFESVSTAMMEAPDNLCMSPRGGLVVCEDGNAPCFVRGLTQAGQVFDFLRNEATGGEFAGGCFSPDGRTLFVNIQDVGVTLAIWGPWENGAL